MSRPKAGPRKGIDHFGKLFQLTNRGPALMKMCRFFSPKIINRPAGFSVGGGGVLVWWTGHLPGISRVSFSICFFFRSPAVKRAAGRSSLCWPRWWGTNWAYIMHAMFSAELPRDGRRLLFFQLGLVDQLCRIVFLNAVQRTLTFRCFLDELKYCYKVC